MKFRFSGQCFKTQVSKLKCISRGRERLYIIEHQEMLKVWLNFLMFATKLFLRAFAVRRCSLAFTVRLLSETLQRDLTENV